MDAYIHLRINNLKGFLKMRIGFIKSCLNTVNFSSEMEQKLQYTCTGSIDCHGMLVKLTFSKYRYFLTIKKKTL